MVFSPSENYLKFVRTADLKLKTAKTKPRIPLLIPCAPGEACEAAEFAPGVRVRELGWAEARDMLARAKLNKECSGPEIARMLRKLRVVHWPHQTHLPHLALYAEDRAAAPQLRYCLRMDNESGIGRCPKCGDWFLQSRPDQVYCSIQHREYHRVVRWRAAEKAEQSEK